MIPFQITFVDLQKSESVDMAIQERIEKLAHLYNRIVRCDVTVSCPHRHSRNDRLYQVHIHISIPNDDVIISHNKVDDETHHDVYKAVHDAFTAAERVLNHRVAVLRREIKYHQPKTERRVETL